MNRSKLRRVAAAAALTVGSLSSGPIAYATEGYFLEGYTGVRLGIEQIHLVIEWIIAVGVVSALKGVGKLDFFERVNGQNL